MAESGGQRPDNSDRPARGAGNPSRGLVLGIAGAIALAVVLAIAGAVASTRDPERQVQQEAPDGPGSAVAASHGPRQTPAPDDLRGPGPRDDSPRPDQPRAQPTPPPAVRGAAATPVPDASAPTAAPTIASATSSSPTPTGSSWTQPPTYTTPGPVPETAPSAIWLAAQARSIYGVEIVLEHQDWGANDTDQARNISAVISAMQMLPKTVSSSIVQTPNGALSVLSNQEGRTLDSWQPYGHSPRNFYTNSDQGPSGYRPSNQIVLATGATPMTIVHEMLHAWTFRNTAPDRYVIELLGDDMRSFMAATGWRQTASDDEVRAAVHEQWEAVNRLFVYEGRMLRYTDDWGNRIVLHSSNPLEALAIVGAIYYARPGPVELPDWPEYWDWFESTLGSPPGR